MQKKKNKIIFSRAQERPIEAEDSDDSDDSDDSADSGDSDDSADEEYDTGNVQAPMPDERSIPTEDAQQMQLDGEWFEEVQYLDIQPDEEAVKDELLDAAPNHNNEPVCHDQDPLAGEVHNACVASKDESFDMGPLGSSLNANESDDCVITSAYYLQDVTDETEEIDDADNWITFQFPSDNILFLLI